MLSEDGGVGTVSSRVRRARSSRGDFRLVVVWPFAIGREARPPVLRAAALRDDPPPDRFGVGGLAAALTVVDRFARAREARRFLASVPNLARREALVLAIISSFRTLTVSR